MQALDMIKAEVSGATSSMSSIPKPLKFMAPMYDKLKERFEAHKMVDTFKVSVLSTRNANSCSL
jgi:hypothetical protein